MTSDPDNDAHYHVWAWPPLNSPARDFFNRLVANSNASPKPARDSSPIVSLSSISSITFFLSLPSNSSLLNLFLIISFGKIKKFDDSRDGSTDEEAEDEEEEQETGSV